MYRMRGWRTGVGFVYLTFSSPASAIECARAFSHSTVWDAHGRILYNRNPESTATWSR